MTFKTSDYFHQLPHRLFQLLFKYLYPKTYKTLFSFTLQAKLTWEDPRKLKYMMEMIQTQIYA